MSGRGRRKGSPDTRGEILEAARESFAHRGFGATTIRGVAATAGVDAALVHHYFGSKDDLFLASLDMPADPREMLAEIFAPGLEGAGERWLDAMLVVWDSPEGRRPLVTLVRNGLAEQADSLLQEGFFRLVFGTLQAILPAEDVEVRAQLLAAQILGLVTVRYVLAMEPLASMDRAELVALVGPSLQRYLDGPLP